ncbi:MAG: fumarate hydratase, partial [Actinomycetota bacterium]|nr:fumarate hydratase [Actinomycetota bacterium]
MTDFSYTDLLPRESGGSETPYRLVTTEGINVVDAGGRSFVSIEPEVLRLLTYDAFHDISHLLRPDHLAQLASILDDPEASPNDRFVALDLLKNANISAGGVLPMCQDTGTAIISGTRGDRVLVTGDDSEALSRGVFDTYQESNLRYSQLAATSMFEEVNTGTNLPAQIDLYAGKGTEYKFAFIQKGGGSANKTFLHQKTKAVLNPDGLRDFIKSAILDLGTSACPPYHLAIVIG